MSYWCHFLDQVFTTTRLIKTAAVLPTKQITIQNNRESKIFIKHSYRW